MMPPRKWLVVALLALLTLALILNLAMPGRDSFEARLAVFMRTEGIAGAVVAHGPIGGEPETLAIGDAAPGRKMVATDRLRLASLAKPITAAAAFALIEQGQLTLDTPVPAAGPGITIRHLLQHSGGWDRALTFDPIAAPADTALLNLPPEHDCMDVAALMPPIQFAPGTRYAYSNIGYCWLGSIIAERSGKSYEDFVAEAVLAPRRAALTYSGDATVSYPNNWTRADYDALGPGGGWLGTAADYWRFAAGPIDPAVTERPPYAQPGQNYYGLGWRVWTDGGLSHFGAIDGLYTAVFRSDTDVTVMLFNGRPADDEVALRLLRDLAAQLRD